ncbi:MAG TPA: beta-lactamase induction protein, partial [Dokdonella sp.]
MAQILLAVLIVLAAAYALPDLARLRDFSWLRALQSRWPGAADDGARGGLSLILLPVAIALVGVLIEVALGRVLFGLPAFAFAVAALFYSWGPRELEA